MTTGKRKNVIANRYEVVQHIGQGGMADVFRAVDTILNREVAIKILRADLSTDAVSILRFEREAQAATALAHPNIVEIYDVGDYKGHHYIVMEYVPGRTLKQVIKARGPLLPEEAVDIMKQLTSAVAEAHSRGIIHRDLKPQNVIVKADGSVKILDFGIATAKGSMQLTQANNVMGSVHYLAPELAKGEPASPQSDIYALGVVMYEMLTGDVPFKADQAVQVALKHMKETIPSVREMNPDLPQSVENIITRASAKNPAMRYKSCDEMWRDLSTCLKEERRDEKKLVLTPEEPKEIKTDTEKTTSVKAKPTTRTHTVKTGKTGGKTNDGKMTKLMVLVIALVSAAALLIALVSMGVIRFGPKMVEIPNLEGLTIVEAREILDQEDLVLESQDIAYKLTVSTEKGKIISVEPAPGTVVEAESKIQVTVSSGIGVYIEDFAASGMNIQEAEAYMSDRYRFVKVTVVEEMSETVEPGKIIRQEQLTPGTLFDPESAGQITLVYAAYPTITIPEDIIGKQIDAAVAELEAMKVTVHTSNIDISQMSQEQIDLLQVGVVIRSDPGPGSVYTQKETNFVVLYYY